MIVNIHSVEERCKYLLDTIENNCKEAVLTRKQIQRLKSDEVTAHFFMASSIEDDDSSYEESLESFDSSFDEEVSFYLESYRFLDDDFTREDLISILPSHKSSHYLEILMRLQAESLREIKSISEIIYQEASLSPEELASYQEFIELEKKKIQTLQELLKEPVDETTSSEEKFNRIVLVPTLSGNIRVLDELKHIPVEYYDDFKVLFQSIVDGTFVGVKKFTNNPILSKIFEVKGFKVRVIFARLSNDTYAIISAFIKKTDTDKYYTDSLSRKVSDYKKIEASLKSKISDDDFLHENELYVQQLFQLISPKDESYQYRKEEF